MAFDIPAGLYWREEEGGLLFGASNPLERPGEATELDLAHLDEGLGALQPRPPLARAVYPMRRSARNRSRPPRSTRTNSYEGGVDGSAACVSSPPSKNRLTSGWSAAG